jgi:hypothetical protein
MIARLSHPIFNIFPQLDSCEIVFTNRYLEKKITKKFERNVKNLFF